jgi:pimeloyl-ACP methyl ester carboxylesterase
MWQQLTTPAGAGARAARRPGTYAGQIREVTSALVTTALWPTGWIDGSRVPSVEGGVGPDADAPAPVLLVHGYGANKSNWFFVRRYLVQAGYTRVDALNYNPFAEDIPGLAARCIERADELKARYGVERIHLIGHSMGGIIVRYAVQVEGLEGVGVVATVSSPHGGNGLARLRPPLGRGLLAAGLQLAPDSTVMSLLRSTARPLDTRFVSYYSNLDLIVPARRAMIREPELGATNILIKDHGHLSIMWSRRLAASIAAQVGAADGRPGVATVRRLPTPPASPGGEVLPGAASR